MGKPDALSRWADHGSGQGDNDNQMLLAPELFWIHAQNSRAMSAIFSERFGTVSKMTCK
jgi:hypothetical protein